MGFVQNLYAAPLVNPINNKARSIPVLNVVNVYGRVFHFAWFGFFLAFWSWYAWPPLLTLTIKKDLGLTDVDVANSNIIALVATLLTRLVAGPACDKYGPRYTFIGCLLAGSIPTVLAGAVTNAKGVMAIRFFVGILGGSFVPCQVWSTGFFDKNIVGRANALTDGLGNSGGGVTYFLMPAIFDSLVARGQTAHVAWRVAFIVPFIMLIFVSLCLFFLCPDTPTGKWSDRHLVVQQNLAHHGIQGTIVDATTTDITEKNHSHSEGTASPNGSTTDHKVGFEATGKTDHIGDHEAQMGEQQMLDTARGEVVKKPTFKEAIEVAMSPQTLVVMFCYFCSFGAELAINSILGTYYAANFTTLGQTGSGRWAAMFGLLNIFARPWGGYVSDLIYVRFGVWGKKMWIHFLGIVAGAFLIAIGLLNSKVEATMFGLFAGFAFFLEGGNGANFSLVPHIHPYANGIVSGFTGATGNLGGIIFAIIFRYEGKNYGKSIWIIGVISIAINLLLCWIKPVPKNQVGGR